MRGASSVLEKGAVPAKQTAKFSKQFQSKLDQSQRLSALSAVAADQQRDYRSRIARLRERWQRLAANGPRTNLLKTFPRSQRPPQLCDSRTLQASLKVWGKAESFTRLASALPMTT